MIALHQFELSPFCDKVRRVMHLKKIPYRAHEVAVATAPLTIRRHNRIGKLPSIDLDDGTRVADSTHIVRFLDSRWPDPPLYPKDPRDKALALILEDWADESLYFFEMQLRFVEKDGRKKWLPELLKRENPLVRALAPAFLPGHFKTILKHQGLGRKPRPMILEELADQIGNLDLWLGDRAWLAGDALSIADIAVFVQLFCIRGAPEGEKALAAKPRVLAWMDRLDRATQP